MGTIIQNSGNSGNSNNCGKSYCDVSGSPCLSKNKTNQVSVSFFWSGPLVDGPKDPWPRVLSLPERFVGNSVVPPLIMIN